MEEVLLLLHNEKISIWADLEEAKQYGSEVWIEKYSKRLSNYEKAIKILSEYEKKD
jgi:hypothetical protein